MLTLDKWNVQFALMEVLYYKRRSQHDSEIVVMRSMGRERQVPIPQDGLDHIDEITKYASWSYEQEVRFVVAVDKLYLGRQHASIKCAKVPLDLTEDFITNRIYNSPVSDGVTPYRDSELRGTVEWDLCSGCMLKKGTKMAS